MPSGGDHADDWESHWRKFDDACHANPSTRYRLRLIEHHVRGDVNGAARLLDLGSGTGELIDDLLQRFPGLDTRGVELSRAGAERARRRAPSATFLVADVMTLDEAPAGWEQWATIATCSEVLEHLDDPAGFLRRARPMLFPGCRVVVTVPSGPMSAFDRHIGHRRHFTQSVLAETLAAGGLEDVTVRAAGFPFFNLYKLGVIARGDRLIEDAEAGTAESGLMSRIAYRLFRVLFRLNLTRSPWGWQLVATARVPPVG